MKIKHFSGRLWYEKELVGLRFEVSEDIYADIDMETLEKYGVSDKILEKAKNARGVREVSLISKNDILISSDELSGQIRVVDVSSNNLSVLSVIKALVERYGVEEDYKIWTPVFKNHSIKPPTYKGENGFSYMGESVTYIKRADGSMGLVKLPQQGDIQFIVKLEALVSTGHDGGKKKIVEFGGNIPAQDEDLARRIAVSYMMDEYNCELHEVGILSIKEDAKMKYLGKPANLKRVKRSTGDKDLVKPKRKGSSLAENFYYYSQCGITRKELENEINSWEEKQRQHWAEEEGKDVLDMLLDDANHYRRFLDQFFEIKTEKGASDFSRNFCSGLDTAARETFVDILWSLGDRLGK